MLNIQHFLASYNFIYFVNFFQDVCLAMTFYLLNVDDVGDFLGVRNATYYVEVR